MKMTLYPNEPIIVNEGVTFVNFQTARYYWQWIQELQVGDQLIFSENGQLISLNKAVQYIGGIENKIDLSKIYAKSILSLIACHADEDNLMQLARYDMAIKTIFQQILFDNDLPLRIEREWDFNELIKSQKVLIDTINSGSAYDKIVDVVRIMSNFSEQRILVFNNIHLYLKPLEILSLHDFSMTHGMKVLSLGMAASPIKKNGEAYHEVFFDEDFVQFGSD